MRCVVFRGVGGRDVMGIEDRPDPVPSPFEVVIAPGYSGVNPADVLQREGRHPVPPGFPTDIPGLEVAGTVVACGSAVSAFEVGDRAFGLVGGGGHATLVIGQERELLKVPEVLADDAAAATPEAFLTAFDAPAATFAAGGVAALGALVAMLKYEHDAWARAADEPITMDDVPDP